MEQFETIRELQAWLQAQGIDCSRWGRDTTKTVTHLWEEIMRGESRMVTNPPRRLVEVIQVVIARDDKILIEASQEFADGRQRPRNYPPSEKMQPGENYLAAARRCLAEELNVSAEESTLLSDTYRQKTREAPSRSYPGLITRYEVHSVEAQAPALPGTPFSTKEKAGGPGDPVLRHYWEWRKRRQRPAPDAT